MTTSQIHTIEFELDKAYLRECFDQSRPRVEQSMLQKYGKAFVLLLIAGFIIQLQVDGLSKHLGAFFIILAIIEMLSQVYARGWWVTRQMLSRNYGDKIQLVVTVEGLSWQGGKQTLNYQWSQINDSHNTELGMVFTTDDGSRHYLSRAHFDEASWAFLQVHLRSGHSV
ncbi:hypothetical protein [Thalassotalea mangrovi]|uniref:YcxB family protein n=1 Tax=Thalassotalea mangrovi TaxID=2572245 RepID=A0A4V5NUA1_9GAMM|nr:hypothetical protein [Thalassotalea mangrovi]TKB44000.1 hypothetical protein E8M12_13595 [Thalassotalea mangrovi]